MELRTEIEIEAPPERVWAVLTDFASYPDWNPFIASIQGDLAEGSELRVELTPPEAGSFRFRPRLLRLIRDQELRWKGHFLLRGLFDGEHFFQLVPVDSGRTRFVHGEDFNGILVKFMGGMLTKTARGFVLMNHALRRRVLGLGLAGSA